MTLGIIIGVLIILLGIVSVGLGISFAMKPSEVKLGLIRPLSIATTYCSIVGVISGLSVVLHNLGEMSKHNTSGNSLPYEIIVGGVAESLIPGLIGFSFLTIVWISVSLGMRKHI